MEFSIRKAIDADEEVVAALAVSFEQFGNYAAVFRAMVRGDRQALAAFIVVGEVEVDLAVLPHGEPVGFVATLTTAEHVDVLGIAVDETERRKGIAVGLLDHVCARAATRGLSVMKCTTAETNEAALRLFAGRGFVDSGGVGTYQTGQRARELRLTPVSSAAGSR